MPPKPVNSVPGGSGARFPRPAKVKALNNAIWKSSSGRKRVGSPSHHETSDVPQQKERRLVRNLETRPRSQAHVMGHRHSDDDALATHAMPVPRQKKRMAPELDDDADRSGHETEEDPDDDIIDDLQALDSSRLRDTLSEELVQWNRQPQGKKSVSSHSTQSQLDDLDDLLDFGERSALTTASDNDHFQGEKEELDDYDEISGDEASLGRPVRTLKSKETKRVKARQAEIPKWGHKAVDSRYRDQTKKAAVAMGFLNENDGLKDFKDDDDAWPDAPWCPPGPGQ
ncbi:hypothetical protein M378DRAFT_18497, partial [Amanita muscaria Koide BX008]